MSIRLWLCRRLMPKGWVAIPRQDAFSNSTFTSTSNLAEAILVGEGEIARGNYATLDELADA